MEIGRFARPRGLEEALELIVEQKGLPVAGGAWLHLGARKIDLAVDLSACGLRYILDRGENVEIGAMATARDLETSPVLEVNFGQLFRTTLAHIVGVQLRNVVTAGGTVAGKYGFSDLNTLLLALDAKVVMHGGPAVDMASFLAAPRDTPFLLEKIIVPKKTRAAFQSLRITNNDFAVLNACAALRDGSWRLTVGSRPASARLCPGAAAILEKSMRIDEAAARLAGEMAAEEVSFGDDTRGSASYRKSLCPTLMRRAILEACR
jgi:CO/xanthine dehydrogenase FAD-binding subunit